MRPIFGFLYALLFSASAFAASTPERPNILFFFADDWGRYASIYADANGPGGINDVVRIWSARVTNNTSLKKGGAGLSAWWCHLSPWTVIECMCQACLGGFWGGIQFGTELRKQSCHKLANLRAATFATIEFQKQDIILSRL